MPQWSRIFDTCVYRRKVDCNRLQSSVQRNNSGMYGTRLLWTFMNSWKYPSQQSISGLSNESTDEIEIQVEFKGNLSNQNPA